MKLVNAYTASLTRCNNAKEEDLASFVQRTSSTKNAYFYLLGQNAKIQRRFRFSLPGSLYEFQAKMRKNSGKPNYEPVN